MKILDLLTTKNIMLEKFYTANESKIMELDDGEIENIEEFYESREHILAEIHIIDSEIEENNRKDIEGRYLLGTVKNEILKAITFKNEIVQRILAQDLQILSYIEQEKSKIIKELRETKVVKKVFSSYKQPSGKINQVDEKV